MQHDKKNWFITLTAALFFFYSFFQMNMMTVLGDSISHDFQINSGTLGVLSAIFFYSNILFILPAGLILDRICVRRVMLANMGIAILGIVLFAVAQSLAMITFARFLSGIMAASAMLSCFKIAATLFPPSKMGLASSLIVVIGMTGGIFSQAPMGALISAFGWRSALFVVAAFGMVLLAVFHFVIKIPKKAEEKETAEEHTERGVIKSLILAMKRGPNWVGGFFVCMLNIPVAILGALFGVSYLKHVYDISDLKAASITSLLFFGMMTGSLVFGFLSDRLQARKKLMLLGAVLCLICVLVVIYVPGLPIWSLYLLFLLTGFTSAAQVLGYPYVAENNTPKLVATGMALASILILGVGYGLGLPLVGKLLELGWDGSMLGGVPFYSLATYHFAFSVIPLGVIISLIMVFFMKEAHR